MLKRIEARVFAFSDAHPTGIPYAEARKQVDLRLLPELLLALRGPRIRAAMATYRHAYRVDWE